MDYVLFAFKSLFRNKRRAVLNLVALVVGIGFIVFILGWVRGYSDIIYEGIINLDTAHIQIENSQLKSQRESFPVGLTVKTDAGFINSLEKLEHVKAVSVRLETPVQLTHGNDSIYMLMRAVQPDKEAAVTTIVRKITQGRFPRGENEIAVSEDFASRMKIDLSDDVSIVMPGIVDIRKAVRTFRISGLFKSGFSEMDKSLILADVKALQGSLLPEGSASRLVIKLDSTKNLSKVLSEINARLPADYTPYPWSEYAATTVEATSLDSQMGFIMAYIILFMILIGIFNSFTMSVQERIKDFATWRALGMRKTAVVRQVALEGLILAVLACFVTAVLTGPFLVYLNWQGFDFASMIPEGLPISIGSRFRMVTTASDIVVSVASTCLVCILCSMIPAWTTSKRKPAQILSVPEW